MQRSSKRSKKKSVESTRFLKNEFSKNHCPSHEELEVIQQTLLDKTGEFVDSKILRDHFQEKRYREKKKQERYLLAKNNREEKSKRNKSDRELILLKAAWKQTEGVCPLQSSGLVRTILDKTTLTYSEIAQWYGQQRHILKHKPHDSLNVSLQSSSTDSEALGTGKGYYK